MQRSEVVKLERTKRVWVAAPSGCDGGEAVNVQRDGGGLGERRR